MTEKTKKRPLHGPHALEQEAEATEEAAVKVQKVLSEAAKNIRKSLEGIPDEHKEEDVQWLVDKGLEQAKLLEQAVKKIEARAKKTAKDLRAVGASMQPL